LVAPDNAMKFISNDNGDSYNLCHFWSNFEIGDLRFFRGSTYSAYFSHLDLAGGFFYERWGDAPVHSIAASLFLNKSDIHFFDEIGYYHLPYTHCPAYQPKYKDKCTCDVDQNFDWKGYSCTKEWFTAAKLTFPDGWLDQVD